ncbi:MAG: hypothetical protein GQ567_00585 [Methanosarcinales archaeon]|nr:hypothetical protein [Methanosarcinales archaeon]
MKDGVGGTKVPHIRETLDEMNFLLKKRYECRLIEIIQNPAEIEKYKQGLFNQWISILGSYREISEKDDRKLPEIPSEYIILGALAEGLVKIVLFFNKPGDYLSIEQRDRTLGKLRNKLITMIKEQKKEPDDKKIKELSDSLELIAMLRNNFIHFPFYFHDDYRFMWVFFQVFAHLLDKFSLWEYLDNSDVEFIKRVALNKPTGIKLLEVDLYEQ